MKKLHTGFMRDVYNPYNDMASSVPTLDCYAEYMTRRIIPGIRLQRIHCFICGFAVPVGG